MRVLCAMRVTMLELMTSRQESVHLSPVNRQAYAEIQRLLLRCCCCCCWWLGWLIKHWLTATALSVTRFQHRSTNYRYLCLSVCLSACLSACICGWTSAQSSSYSALYRDQCMVSIERSACSVMVNKRTKSINNALRTTAANVVIAECWWWANPNDG